MSFCTSSAVVAAAYLRISRARWISTVRWLMPSALPISLRGQALHHLRRHLALARRELGLGGAARAQVLEGPDAGLVRRGAVERLAAHVAPEGLAREGAVQAAEPLHHAVVGIAAAGVEDRLHALADALEFGDARVEHLERLADQRIARGAEHLAQARVAVHDDAVARQHHAHRRLLEGEPVVDGVRRGVGCAPLRNTTYACT